MNRILFPARSARDARRPARRVVSLLLALTASAGLAVAAAGTASAQDLTFLKVSPVCGPESSAQPLGVWSCTQTFTQSGVVNTSQLGSTPGQLITITAVGAAGGASQDGTPGGLGGLSQLDYDIPASWGGFATFDLSIGGVGGNGSGGSGGAGGSGGGAPGGSGLNGGSGGGGGGGATVVTATSSFTGNAAGQSPIVAGPGGGGAASGVHGGNGDARGSYASGTAVDGGAGASAQSASGYGELVQNPLNGGGGGGGGGASNGGSGGAAQSYTTTASDGGGGSTSTGYVQASHTAASVTFAWLYQQATAVTVSAAAQPGTASVQTVTAQVTNPSVSATPAGTVQFALDGQPYGSPVPVAGTGSATTTLTNVRNGSHSLTATFKPGPSDWQDVAATSGPTTVTVTGNQVFALQLSTSVTTLSQPQLLERNGSSGSADIWQDVKDSSGAVVANETWEYVPSDAAGYGELVNRASGTCLEVNGTTGTVDLWACVPGATNELWHSSQAGSSATYWLQVLSSGQYLGLQAPAQAVNGTPLTMGGILLASTWFELPAS